MKTGLAVLTGSVLLLTANLFELAPLRMAAGLIAAVGRLLSMSGGDVAAFAAGFGFLAIPAVVLWTHTPVRLGGDEEPLWRRASR